MSYQGSKGSFVKRLIKYFPKADNFYDLFGGGGSVTHAVADLKANVYKTINYNELNPLIFNLFEDAANGEFNYDKFLPKWVSGAEFILKIRHKNGVYSYMYSFASAHRKYRYNKSLAPLMKSIHDSIIFNEFDATAKLILGIDSFDETMPRRERRIFYGKQSTKVSHEYIIKMFDTSYVHMCGALKKKLSNPSNFPKMISIAHLESLERLQNISSINRENLFTTNLSYEDVNIKPNSLVYIDPPYNGTTGYAPKTGTTKFNTNKLLHWASRLNEPVLISEYSLTHPAFTQIASFNTDKNQDTTKTTEKKEERLYANRFAIDALKTNKEELAEPSPHVFADGSIAYL